MSYFPPWHHENYVFSSPATDSGLDGGLDSYWPLQDINTVVSEPCVVLVLRLGA